MTSFVAKSKLNAAEDEIKRLTAALLSIWSSLANGNHEVALAMADEALNGPRP